jgi:hypothetical protein
MRCFSCSLISSAALSCWLCCVVGGVEAWGLELLCCALELLCEELFCGAALCGALVVESPGAGADPVAGC